MARIVLGIGTSHGPLLSTPAEQWDLRARADRENPSHHFRGRTYDFDSLLGERAPGFAGEIGLETRRERQARCQAALDALASRLGDSGAEALVLVGNDQRELFDEEITPALMVYRGSGIENIPYDAAHLGPGLAIAEKGNTPAGGAVYPGAPELADHITRTLSEEGFDPAQSSKLRRSQRQRHGIPHAYGFVYNRLLANRPPPSVPLVLNVHYPHNRPSAGRCLALGRALGLAIRRWGGCERVAVIASGGLSHFVIDEMLDRKVLAAMESGDEQALAALPEAWFQGGTAEIKNWLPVVSAVGAGDLQFHLVDYVPCYRSEAGTGNAMGFVYWR
jgi:OH-DDVA oxygenase